MSIFQDYPFYYSTIPGLITAFGQLFEGLRLQKRDSAGNVTQTIEVPVEFAPKNKWMTILREDPTKLNNVEITLPRMSYEITQYKYDAARKIGVRGANLPVNLPNGSRAKLYNPVPYDVYIELSSLCKTQTDALMIIEQILPYFAPSMHVQIMILPDLGITKSIPIVLSSVTQTDSYDGNPTDFRLIETTFQFIAQLDLFGPIPSGAEIKNANVGISTNHLFPEQIIIPELSYNAAVTPSTAEITDPHTIVETWTGST